MRKELRTNSTAVVVPMPASTTTPSRSPEMTHRMPPGLDVSRRGSPIVLDHDYDSLHPVASSSSSPSTFAASTPDTFNTFGARPALGDSIYRPPSVPFPELNFGLDESFDFSLHLDVKGKKRAVENSYDNGNGMNGDGRFDAFGYGGTEGHDSAPYVGSFDPFADHQNQGFPSAGSPSSFDRLGLANGNRGADSDGVRSSSSSPPPSGDELASRRSSRFGFARRGSHGIGGVMPISGSGGVRSSDIGSSFARSAFTSPGPGSGRESPITTFAPPGLHYPQLQSQRSSVSYPSDGGRPTTGTSGMGTDSGTLWPGINLSSAGGYGTPPLPAALLRSLAGNGIGSAPTTNTSSPQLSPRSRTTSNIYSPNLPSPTPTSSSAATPQSLSTSNLPPGISLNRPPMSSLPLSAQMPMQMSMPMMGMSPSSYPLPAASFPLPPATPRTSTGGSGKNDLLAMIAAAQANNKAKNAAMGLNGSSEWLETLS
jgi:hypothetical protein